MSSIRLTKPEARKIILYAAGLAKRGQFGRGKEAVYKFIDHLGFVQVDTNFVVERAHHHAIASRVPDYKLEWLEELQSDARIFEFWTFASGFMPMTDFRFSLPVKDAMSKRWTLSQTDLSLMRKILDRVSREGPLRARDFENDRVTKSKGWWDWRPSKVALEQLHSQGKLVTTRMKDFHKLYDLPENIIPGFADIIKPSLEEYARYVVRRALKSMGVAYLNEITWHARLVHRPLVANQVKKMVEEGEVIPVEVDGLKKAALFTLKEYSKKKINIAGDTFILSPFDILNVFRRRLRDFFDFDYQVECFVPAPKRKYGYFSLPILVGDTFIARMDSKADRKQKVLTINNLHFEDVKITKEMIEDVSDAINRFAKFNQCQSVVISKCNKKNYILLSS
jgi:uncharacterized protein YcaQ